MANSIDFSNLITVILIFHKANSLVCAVICFFQISISYTELFQWTIICFIACFIGLFILACLMRMLHSLCLLSIGFLSLASYESAGFQYYLCSLLQVILKHFSLPPPPPPFFYERLTCKFLREHHYIKAPHGLFSVCIFFSRCV